MWGKTDRQTARQLQFSVVSMMDRNSVETIEGTHVKDKIQTSKQTDLFHLLYSGARLDPKIRMYRQGGFTADICREEETGHRCGDLQSGLFCNQGKSQSAKQEMFFSVSSWFQGDKRF